MTCNHKYRNSQNWLFCIYCGKKISDKPFKIKKNAKIAIIVTGILMAGIIGYLNLEGKIIIIEQLDSATEVRKNSEFLINDAKSITENITKSILTDGISDKFINDEDS